MAIATLCLLFRRPAVWLFVLCMPLLLSCTKSSTVSIKDVCSSLSSPCLLGKVLVQMRTNRGTITVEVDGDAAPVTAGNFVDLVKRGVYNGTVFNRVVKEPLPFVVQGGDPASADPKTLKSNFGKGIFIDPASGQARFIPLEVKLNTEDQPRYGQLITDPSDLLQLQLSHQSGSLAMQRSQAPDSASAEFYIALRPLPQLDGRYAVFGRVRKGLEVVDAIRQGDRIVNASLLMAKPTLNAVPMP